MNPVGWFEIYVHDMNRAKAFYQAVFEMPLTHLPSPGAEPGLDMWAFPMGNETYGASGALVKMPGFEAGHNSVIVYFHCPDCALFASKAAKAGGRIVKEKMSIGEYGHIALVTDTEGNVIGLHSME